MQQRDTTISLMNVTKRFGDLEAVSDATLSVRAGEVVGFVGPNGAGKTTTIAMIMGFIKPTLGRISILGNPIDPATAHKTHRSIGYAAGDMILPPTLTGSEYLRFCAGANGRDTEHYERLIATLSPILDKPLKALSRGNKQKIALISALQHAPQVLVLDEPTSGLDPLMQDIFLATLQKEAARGATVFMSSHILSEVSSICSRVLFMRSGKIILDKPLSSITAQLGKQVTITTREIKKLAHFLPNDVQILSQNKGRLIVSVPEKEIKPFLRWLMTKNFDDLLIENRDVDDIFHQLYAGNEGKPT